MAQGVSKADEAGKATGARERLARQAQEIRTAADFARFMTAVMAALISEEINSQAAMAICGTANTMLKAIEMQVRYRQNNKGRGDLVLTESPDVTNVTHVTSVTKPELQEVIQPSQPPEKTIAPKKGNRWCTDCYVGRKLYISATEEVEGDPLCLPCANKRRKQIDPDYKEDH